MSKALRAPDYLEHILEALARIGRYTGGIFEPRLACAIEANALAHLDILRTN